MTTAQCLVSVVITCYNQARFLGEAIESVLRQTHTLFEITVVDDGSVDNTSEIVAHYPNVHYVRQENQGTAAARNTGLRRSKGDYIVFLDGDDRLLPRALEVNLSHLQTDLDYGFASGRCRFIAADGSLLPTWQHKNINREHYNALLEHGCYIWMPGKVMYRRKALEAVNGFKKVLGNISISNTTDYDIYLRITRKFPVYSHDEVIAEWRRHGNNTSNNAAMMLKSTLAILKDQQRQNKGDKHIHEICRRTIKGTRNFFGEQMVEKIRSDIRKRQWRSAVEGTACVLYHAPNVFARHAKRKVQCVVLKVIEAVS